MSALGELYYEGKEYEARLEHLRPGVLSAELREALGMSDATSPPPWLVNMQVCIACWWSCNSLVMVLMHVSSDVESRSWQTSLDLSRMLVYTLTHCTQHRPCSA
jgi:hypothetical protein